MKKIILLLCLMMFMVVGAKHYSKNDKNPNATVFIKLSFPSENKNRANKGNSGIWTVDDTFFHKWAFVHSSYFDSAKIEPGFHEIAIHHEKSGQYGNTKIKYDFKENKTYIIEVYADKSIVKAKVVESEETE